MTASSRAAVGLRVAATCAIIGPPIGGGVAAAFPVLVWLVGRLARGAVDPASGLGAVRTIAAAADLLAFVVWASYAEGLAAALLAGIGLCLAAAAGRRLPGALTVAVGVAAVPAATLLGSLPGLVSGARLDAVGADVLFAATVQCPVAAVSAAVCWHLFPAETRPA